MNNDSQDPDVMGDHNQPGVQRRSALKRMGLLAGAAGSAWAAPSVFGSSSASAASGTSAIICGVDGKVTIPAYRTVYFELVGGGGGGGGGTSNPGGAGGNGSKVTGSIASKTSPFVLSTFVGYGGKQGQAASPYGGDGGASGYGRGATEQTGPTMLARPAAAAAQVQLPGLALRSLQLAAVVVEDKATPGGGRGLEMAPQRLPLAVGPL